MMTLLAGRKEKAEQREREIFEYFDGEQMRRVDPLQAWHTFWSDPDFQPGVECQEADAGDTDALHRVAKKVCQMFPGVQIFDGERGLTLDECNTVLAEFIEYMIELKKKRPPSPTPQPPTDSASSPDGSTTEPEPGSFSMDPAPTSDEPTSSSTPSEPPSPAS